MKAYAIALMFIGNSYITFGLVSDVPIAAACGLLLLTSGALRYHMLNKSPPT